MSYEATMRFYDGPDGEVCRNCRDELLSNVWLVLDGGVEDAEPLQPRDFQALGTRPWAGEDVGDRYIQCNHCNGQWGPDA
jgi:hypothetical protein